MRLVDGEIQLKGPNLFPGYWRREDATRAAFTDDGWFRTGDLATCAPDGYYTLSGRKSDLIISGGFNIYPREIEEFLQEQPEIAEAAVIAHPDPVRGEVPVAYIVCRTPVDPADLDETPLRDELPPQHALRLAAEKASWAESAMAQPRSARRRWIAVDRSSAESAATDRGTFCRLAARFCAHTVTLSSTVDC